MRVLLTGVNGFLGWHTRLRLSAQGEHVVVPVGRSNWSQLSNLLTDCDAVIHIAGVNRGEPEEVAQGNLDLATELGSALRSNPRSRRVVFANSIQAGNGTDYGQAKESAAQILQAAAESTESSFVDVRLPNLFGEHGRPKYNSFVATFIAATIAGETPQINDNEVSLLPAQNAAQALIDALTGPAGEVAPVAEPHSVREVWDMLQLFHGPYLARAELPDLSTPFAVALFNAYRSALFPGHYPLALTPHSDPRGTFVETVRVRGGQGQSSVSTTLPGITRGEHYHLTKIERFAVIGGSARISLRRMFFDEVIHFDVSGEQPVAIDMPTGWVHNITNTGNDTLLTQFWSHELFVPEAPDTYPEPVGSGPSEENSCSRS